MHEAEVKIKGETVSDWAVAHEVIYLSILKEINPGISLEGMMLKLKLKYFWHLMQKELTHWKRL